MVACSEPSNPDRLPIVERLRVAGSYPNQTSIHGNFALDNTRFDYHDYRGNATQIPSQYHCLMYQIGWSPLIGAVSCSNEINACKLVSTLLEFRADPNLLGAKAVDFEKKEMVKLLVDAGAEDIPLPYFGAG